MPLSKMVLPVGVRFSPTDEEIIEHYLRPKNLGGDTSQVDGVISTVKICSHEPRDLPSKASVIVETRDQVWYFYVVKENKYNKGDRQRRKTKSGFWKKTGDTMDIIRKKGNREKMGEKKVLMFYENKINGASRTNWVMHEYHATLLSPDQMMTYTICKVEFKGQEIDIEHSPSLIPPIKNFGGLITGFAITGSIDDYDALDNTFANIMSEDFVGLADDDNQSKIDSMVEDRSVYIPKKPLTGVFSGHGNDDSDSDSISSTTASIQTSSTCDSFGSSNHRVDQIKDLQESPTLTIKDTPEKTKKNPNDDAQGTDEIGGHKLGQKTVTNKRAGFFCRMIQKFVKKIHLCSSVSRT